jgi:hypothetical protein
MEDNMIGTTHRRSYFFAVIISAAFLLLTVLIAAPPGFTHGGKLARVEISNRNKGGRQEIVVSFQRPTGEPKTLYIFFSADGRYAGSNFTGR